MTDPTALTLIIAGIALVTAAVMAGISGRAGDLLIDITFGVVIGGLAANVFGNPDEFTAKSVLVITMAAALGVLIGWIAGPFIALIRSDRIHRRNPMNTPAGTEPHAPVAEASPAADPGVSR